MKVCSKYLNIISILILILCLTGCFNLGDFEEQEKYYETFKEVKLITLDKTIKSYSTEDYFYTEEGINDYECDIPKEKYIYAAIKVEKDILLDDLSLSFYSESTGNLFISVFVVDVIPSNIRGFDDIKNEDEDGNTIDYDDPVSAIETCVVPLDAGEWRTTMIVDYYKNNYLSINEGQYLLIRFENNSWIGNQKGYSKMEFMLTNLLICAQGS
jgi:hypothetical protein